jgi:voltage-gated potassium channel
VLALILLATLMIGTSYEVNRKVAYRALVPFCLLWVVARILEAFAGPGRIYSHLAPAAGLGLSCAALFIIFHRFFSVSMVTRAMLAEAFVCYLIIAIAFSQLYVLLSRMVDQPFNEQIPFTQSSTFLYFSMGTLSGVGAGVIAPINPYIRLVTGIENMIGIFYLAVVVSRLVSSYRPRNRQRHQPADLPTE